MPAAAAPAHRPRETCIPAERSWSRPARASCRARRGPSLRRERRSTRRPARPLPSLLARAHKAHSRRTARYTPEVTIVAAWMSAENGCWALHGVRQPHVERDLSRLAGGREKQQRGNGVVLRTAHLDRGVRLRSRRAMPRHRQRAPRRERHQHGEHEAEVPHSIDEKRLQSGR